MNRETKRNNTSTTNNTGVTCRVTAEESGSPVAAAIGSFSFREACAGKYYVLVLPTSDQMWNPSTNANNHYVTYNQRHPLD